MLCLLIALVAGALVTQLTPAQSAWVGVALVILGVIVGLTTIAEKEVTPFLLAAVVLLVAGGAGAFLPLNDAVAGLGTAINGIVANFVRFVAPAAVILSAKAIYGLARK